MPKLIGTGQLTLTDLNDAIVSGTAPSNPTNGTLWLDTSVTPNMMKMWNGSTWKDIGEMIPDLSDTITDITETLGNMANDGVLDYNERQVIKDKVTDIIGYVIADSVALPTYDVLDASGKGSFFTVRKQAQQIGISTSHAKYTAVKTTYEDLKTYLEGLKDASNATLRPWDTSTVNQKKIITVVKGTFRDKWLQFYLSVDDLATYTIQVAKENVDNSYSGGTNYASNGSFEIPLIDGLWKDQYSVSTNAGSVKDIVDISTEEPPFKSAYHVKNTANANGGIFSPVLWSGKPCEQLVNKEVTIQYWLKYQNITQGASGTNLGRFGELIIEGETSGGQKVPKYVRIHSDNTATETLYISGTNMTWKKYTATIKLSLPATTVKLSKISFKHGLEGCVGEFWTTGIKIEFGNKASDWSQSPFDLEQRIYKSELAVKPDSIVSTVTSHQTFINKVDETVGNAVSDLTVGNVNLIDNSMFLDGNGWRNWGGSGTRTLISGVTLDGVNTGARFVASASGEFGYAKDNVPVVQGQEYVLSAWVYISTAGGIAKVQEGTTGNGYTYTSKNTINGWVRIIHKFKAKSNLTNIYLGQDSASPACTMIVTAVQLEKGNIPSEWGLSKNDTQWGGGRNLLRNSNFSKYKTNDTLTWDKSLNGNLVPDGWWSNGYNTGAKPKPLEGYHAHLNIEKFGYPVLEFIDKNSNITDPTGNPTTGLHRWLGMNNSILASDPLFQSLAVGKTYTISMEVMSDTLGMRVNTGMYHFETGNTTQDFYGYQWNLQDCLVTNVWERKYKTFTIGSTWDLTKEFAFYLYGYFSTAEGKMWVRNVKIEEGYKYTDWSATPEDTDAFMYNIADRVSSAEEKITDSSIINTVTQSNTYKNDLDGKAFSSDLKDLATKGEVDSAKQDAQDYADGKVNSIDFTPYVIKSELSQEINNLTVKFESGGGVNLLRNSVGFADFSFWTTLNPQYITTVANSALDSLGFGRGFYFPANASGANSRLTQDVYVTAGQPYTLSWYANKTNASPTGNDDGAIWVEILQGAVVMKSGKLNSEQVTSGFTKFSYTYIPTTNVITVRISVNKLADFTISGIMLNIGSNALQWSMATGEIYNTNIRMDMNGIRVAQIVNGVDRGYTEITPESFAGWYDTDGDGVYEKVFYLQEDETVSKKVTAKEEFTMGNIKIIKVQSTASTGWAFVENSQ